MATEFMELEVQNRTILGKKVKNLRNNGLTPIHLYGREFPSMSLQTETLELYRILRQAGRSQPVSLQLGESEEAYIAFVRGIDFHPLTNQVIHVDFLRVDTSRPVDLEVAIVLTGESPAVRQLRGILIRGLSSLHIECLPIDAPSEISVDISGLDDFEKVIRVSDLPGFDNVTVLSELDRMIASVSAPSVQTEESIETTDVPAEKPEGESEDSA